MEALILTLPAGGSPDKPMLNFVSHSATKG
jgi:hypothetical protein